MSELEKFDVLDELGNKTGEVLNRDIVFDKELWHGAVHVFVINSANQILLQFRGPEKKLAPNCWDTSVAGHISAGDSPLVSAVREVAEEIGIETNEVDYMLIGTMAEDFIATTGKRHKEHEWVFVLNKDLDIEKLKIQKSELVKVKWFTTKEIRDILGSSKRRNELSMHDDSLFMLAINAADGNLNR